MSSLVDRTSQTARDRAARSFRIRNRSVKIPSRSYSVQQIMDRIWSWDSEAEINVVWVNISTLRKKLAELNTGVEILAHRGTGYSLEKKT